LLGARQASATAFNGLIVIKEYERMLRKSQCGFTSEPPAYFLRAGLFSSGFQALLGAAG
jgi:hypothetical protein